MVDLAVLVILAAFTLRQVPLSLLLLDTTTIGGDTPAHNYLASQLHHQLEHGRLVGWAPGWWAGFPAFQYYFVLPYLLIALLSSALPFNLAFKLVSMLGVLALPTAAYASMRLLRLPRPVPILTAIVALPFLFVQSHTMWGVNLYSTMAGMLANSLSFPIMLLTLGLAWRDARSGHARPLTAVVGALLLASHFFTSIMAALALAFVPLLMPRGERWPALRTLMQTGLTSGLLMAWWILPLRATRAFSVDFGTNWSVALAETLPAYGIALLPFALYALYASRNQRHPAVPLLGVMSVLAGLLFTYGYAWTPVFVNIRLWPFLFWGLLALGTVGIGLAAQTLRAQTWLIAAALAAALLYVEQHERQPPPGLARVRDWAAFNYRGLEKRPGYDAFKELLLPLAGTPGRLAGDLADANNGMGSSRILELVPHLIDKEVLEGGLVNSALSSYFVYATQCETSDSCAGYPTIVQPGTFNLDAGTRHLELFNVKHFLARAPTVQAALREDPRWTRLRSAAEWELFELQTHNGSLVTRPERHPLFLETPHWERDSLEWFSRPELLDQPVVFRQPGQPPPPAPAAAVSAGGYRRLLGASGAQRGEIEAWLRLGPYSVPAGLTNALEHRPITEHGLDPQAGDRVGRQRWEPLFTRSPVYPGRFLERTENIVLYAFVNLFAPAATNALLHCSSDDGATLWLNDLPVLQQPRSTGLHGVRTVPVRLQPGRNRLLLKSTQLEGAHFFHVRLTDLEGHAIPDLVADPDREPPAMPARAAPTRDAHLVVESVDANRIRFRTDALGEPHLIKVSYFPNWKVTGARAVYLVTPSFMLVYPEQHEVELTFGRTAIDYAGMGLTGLGWLVLIARIRRRCDSQG